MGIGVSRGFNSGFRRHIYGVVKQQNKNKSAAMEEAKEEEAEVEEEEEEEKRSGRRRNRWRGSNRSGEGQK